MSKVKTRCIFGGRDCVRECIFYYETIDNIPQCLVVDLMNALTNIGGLIGRCTIWRIREMNKGEIKI